LFLDELPEYSKQVLETLREPLESKEITLSRANFSITYPASFILIAAMNPCPCGFYMDAQKACSCRPHTITRYWKKISGPILDRIDIIIDVPRLTQSDYIQSPLSSYSPKPATHESLTPIRSFILKRSQNTVNAQLTPKELATFCQLNNASQLFLSEQVANGTLTGRSHDKVIKVARSIADMELSPTIEMHHILESLQYRKQTYKT